MTPGRVGRGWLGPAAARPCSGRRVGEIQGMPAPPAGWRALHGATSITPPALPLGALPLRSPPTRRHSASLRRQRTLPSPRPRPSRPCAHPRQPILLLDLLPQGIPQLGQAIISAILADGMQFCLHERGCSRHRGRRRVPMHDALRQAETPWRPGHQPLGQHHNGRIRVLHAAGDAGAAGGRSGRGRRGRCRHGRGTRCDAPAPGAVFG